MPILISSAVRSPMSRLYLRLMCWMIASSILSPPTRTLFAHDAGAADHRDVGRAAADVDDHVAGGLADGQAGADGRGNGLLDQVDLAGTRALGGLSYRAPLDLGDARG